ncbi:hypothetical protein BASA81_002079 [Batrachochytrium salamandrivorans]|nr:hypothetical protein BASA81_002079 [Batrachochytrium salamandrivorans]
MLSFTLLALLAGLADIVDLTDFATAKRLAGEGLFFLVLQRNGQVFGVGFNLYGQLGLNTITNALPRPSQRRDRPRRPRRDPPRSQPRRPRRSQPRPSPSLLPKHDVSLNNVESYHRPSSTASVYVRAWVRCKNPLNQIRFMMCPVLEIYVA